MSGPSNNRVAYVVDDEHVVSFTLATILRLQGFDATAFTEPLLALDAARFRTPDLLISDVIMPRLSGIDLALTIRRECPNCKIFLLSGQAATADLLAEAGVEKHTFELLAKPMRPADLLLRIHSAMNSPLH